MTVWDDLHRLGLELGLSSSKQALWDRLVAEGKFDLIERLQRAERGEPGFRTIVVPEEGFSVVDETHNEVLRWLMAHRINVCNPGLLIARMERALHPSLV